MDKPASRTLVVFYSLLLLLVHLLATPALAIRTLPVPDSVVEGFDHSIDLVKNLFRPSGRTPPAPQGATPKRGDILRNQYSGADVLIYAPPAPDSAINLISSSR